MRWIFYVNIHFSICFVRSLCEGGKYNNIKLRVVIIFFCFFYNSTLLFERTSGVGNFASVCIACAVNAVAPVSRPREMIGCADSVLFRQIFKRRLRNDYTDVSDRYIGSCLEIFLPGNRTCALFTSGWSRNRLNKHWQGSF